MSWPCNEKTFNRKDWLFNLLMVPIIPWQWRLRRSEAHLCIRQVSKDREGKVVGKGDMRAQIERVGENIRLCLEAAGATLADLVRTTTYVTDIDEFFKHSDIRHRYFGPALPTSTTIEVRRLALPDYLVEIDALAIV
jgi:enamine deaminase RidA (YjgF/YER057c/UK114 family)